VAFYCRNHKNPKFRKTGGGFFLGGEMGLCCHSPQQRASQAASHHVPPIAGSEEKKPKMMKMPFLRPDVTSETPPSTQRPPNPFLMPPLRPHLQPSNPQTPSRCHLKDPISNPATPKPLPDATSKTLSPSRRPPNPSLMPLQRPHLQPNNPQTPS